ncbi:hypothetical protein N1851_011325 [Merluccius polli]|uniref:Uncharacterized protein n=1 Tax=Merluccius polli TaxID=89951 RepID=A0AA47MY06_MERPO|nr:hypothetical protein N1851_011325 [Merluccius polli]
MSNVEFVGMPRGKSFRRSVAARRREAVRADVEHLPPSPEFVPGRGTGTRSRPRQYPVSVSGKTHKLVVPAHSVDKKFVLVVGDSHLRTVADGNVMMPKGNLSFGIMTTPGASACHLRTEVLDATLPRTPDAVCILAPGNNLTTSSTPAVAGEEFRKLLISARERWHNVFVLDFVPRLTVSPELQNHVSREFHSVAKSLGIPRYSTLEHFPFRQRHLWVRDGVHLSDVDGMGILTQLLWQAAYMHLEVTAPAPRTPPREELYPVVLGATGEAIEALIRETRRCNAAKKNGDLLGRQLVAAQARVAGLAATVDRLQDTIDGLQLDMLEKYGQAEGAMGVERLDDD